MLRQFLPSVFAALNEFQCSSINDLAGSLAHCMLLHIIPEAPNEKRRRVTEFLKANVLFNAVHCDGEALLL